MDNGYKRAIQTWHRRSGKDKTDFNYMVKEAARVVAPYFYLMPTYSQGKKVIWDGIDNDGFRFIDHVPKPLIAGLDATTMKITLKTGSIIQIVGTDNVDSIVGTNPRGCVFGEYSLHDPRAWQYLRPILAANDGWAIFNFTPRQHNHAWELLEIAKADPKNWYIDIRTVDDTKAIPEEVLKREREEMRRQTGSDALYQQEYYCSFDVPVEGSYYANQMMEAEGQGRITNVPYETSLSVDTYWDLGIDDSMTIWFVQQSGMEIRVIDYYENNGEGLAHYANVLQEKKYVYGHHTAPHDIEVRELGTGKSRLETAKSLGISFRVAPKLSIEDGIEASRNILSRCWFDKTKCDRGLNALKSYHKEWDEKNKVYRPHPEHDWSSHGADGFRTFAVGFKKPYVIPQGGVGGVQPYYPGLPG